jgi:hypothetical protein
LLLLLVAAVLGSVALLAVVGVSGLLLLLAVLRVALLVAVLLLGVVLAIARAAVGLLVLAVALRVARVEGLAGDEGLRAGGEGRGAGDKAAGMGVVQVHALRLLREALLLVFPALGHGGGVCGRVRMCECGVL